MYDAAVQNLIDELGRLPGVGPKSAQRIAFYILNSDSAEMEKLTNAINTVKRTVSFCEVCGNVSETKLCGICRDPRRNPSAICVVEESKDVVAVERTRAFNGRYHVLGGAINPLAGLGPDQLRIRELVARLSDERIQEIILAMDPNLEGEATATYLSRLLVPLEIRVSRLASGLPVGGDLEYADEITLGRAMEGRRIISEGTRTEPKNAVAEFEEAIAAEEQKQPREPANPAPVRSAQRWSGSMFEDITESVPESSMEGSPGKLVLESDEPASDSSDQDGVQGSLNESLLEQELEKQQAKQSTEHEPQEMPTDATSQNQIPGDSDSLTDSVSAGHDVEPTAQENQDAEAEQKRRDDYEEKLAELNKTTLRTPKPNVPPIPGVTYVNPWT